MPDMTEILAGEKGFWNNRGPRNDIVLSTRVRLGRNSAGIPFADTIDENSMALLSGIAQKYISSSTEQPGRKFLELAGFDLHEKRLLREKNIITSEMENSTNAAVILDQNKDFSILINDTDHFRIQVIRPGFQLNEAFTLAESIDDELNKSAVYAFSDLYGYLTPNPANTGTGLKVSLILHLPVLTIQKRINETVPPVRESGFQITGTLGNSGRIIGCLYLVCNKRYIGVSEIETLDIADDLINRIMKLEDDARDEFFTTSRRELEDSVFRSLGMLLYSRRINYAEALEHLSRLRLGIVMSVIRETDVMFINDLMVRVQLSHLQEHFGVRFRSILDSDDFRAMFLRDELKKTGELNV